MRKSMKMLPLLLGALLLSAGTASAHVSVTPAETKQGSYEVFTVRVPTEKQSSTTKLEVKFPEGVSISRVKPLPGWTYTLDKDAEGGNTAITWTAQAQGIADGEFEEFHLQGKVADDAGQLVWKAYQTYADGSVVEWVGAAGTEEPASVTKVQPGRGAGAEDHHSAASGHEETSASAHENDWLRSPSFIIALAALAAGLIALSLSLRKSKRAASQ
ncbi:YcnI family protein [Paenibacillus beijingensis]|uniref:YncI copper-binding domain-containing protein n=1 Tax=Paenibacillus beijingensis TaxID=1126833 RepID=A0A0D5NNR1_9BACL|nr:YcnI family protein [Paenibacillus beijingensis]AJY76906.1 hypothetical protein VN24_23020 [Paenibacillus beijingensis]